MIGQGVHLHLLDHAGEAVGAGGGEVLAEAYGVDEVELGVEYLLRGVPVEGADEQGDDAAGDDGVAVGAEV